MKISENQKVTLTIGQLKRLIRESEEERANEREALQKRIDELEDELYDLDRYYIAHHVEYSDKYWNQWYLDMGYLKKDRELVELKKQLSEM